MALLLSIITGLCAAIWPYIHWPWLAIPFVMFIRMALNAIDGMLAREHNMQSKRGAILNEMSDVFSDIALYLPFMTIAGTSAWVIALVVALAVASEMMGVVSIQIGGSRRYDGPMGKSDRAFVFGAIALAVAIGITPGPWIGWLAGIISILLGWTIFNRAKAALKECNG